MKQTLKKLSAFMMALALSGALYAQVPQKFNYQGIARDVKGNPISKQSMSIKLTVLPTSDATEGEYEEIQNVTTNEFGLYTLQIGNGTALKGTMAAVKWETGNKYIKVAIDPKGGSDFVEAGTNQLLSVPYAIYADKAGVAKQGGGSDTRATNNYIEKTNGSGVTNSTSQIYDNGTSIGIGTAAPAAAAKLHMLATAGNTEHIRMQNTNPTGWGKFMLYNDVSTNYATFTKYGSTFPGGYTGITSMYPYANMLAFGNNVGPFLLSNNGNIGINVVNGGTSTLKFNAQQNTGYVGIGGNALPTANIHFNNTNGTGDTLKLTNNTTGHTSADGFEIRNTGEAAQIVNKELGMLMFGTNNTERARFTANGDLGIGTTNPLARLHINSSDNSFLGSTLLSGTAQNLGLSIRTTSNGNTTGLGFEDSAGVKRTSIYFAGSNSAFSDNLMITTDANGNTADLSINRATKNVGLGVYNAQTKLHVVGDEYISGNRYMFLSGTSNADKMLMAHSPAYTNYGIQYQDATDRMNFLSNGTTVLGVDLATQRVGIGTNAPTTKLDVVGQVKISGGAPGLGKVLTSDASGLATWTTPAITSSTGTSNYITMFKPNGTTLANSYLLQGGSGLGKYIVNTGSYAWHDTVNGNLFNISIDSNGRLLFNPNNYSGGTPYMILDDVGGRLTIGNVSSTPSGYKLYVEDGILTERLKVAVSGSANWADYVFADDYKLMPLEEVEAFVKENKHLPNVPSAEKMVETGIDVATVDAKLMEKIEELTLYMIEMKKEIKSLKAENENMKANLKK